MLKYKDNIVVFKSLVTRAFVVSCPHCAAFRIYYVPAHIPKVQREKYADDLLGSLIKCNGKGNKDCMCQS